MATSTKRRTRTRATGVYRSTSGRYEITYYDSAGKFRSQVVDGDFETAKATWWETISSNA